jgi:hypothetical protein
MRAISDEDILLALAGAFKGAKAVIGGVQGVECRVFAELLADGLKEVQVRELVARAAEDREPPAHQGGPG